MLVDYATVLVEALLAGLFIGRTIPGAGFCLVRQASR
jgi:hypothetical protein